MHPAQQVGHPQHPDGGDQGEPGAGEQAGRRGDEEWHHEPTSDGGRRDRFLFLFIAGRGEPERQASAEEGDMDE